MHRIALATLATSMILLVGSSAPLPAQEEGGDPFTVMLSVNDGLRAQGMDYMLQQIDYLNRDGGRASERYFQKEFRWVPSDTRRGSSGAGLDFLFDESREPTSPTALPAVATIGALDRAIGTWGREQCMRDVPLTRTPYGGGDVTVFDFLAGDGDFGDPFAADVVIAGFPTGLEELFGPDTLAFSVTFVFVDGQGEPTDVNGDGYLDTALSEVYLNPAFDWTLAADGEGHDVETVLLHEVGHALGLGHFGPPPQSVMSPVYSGVQRKLRPIDHAALCVVYGRQ